MNQLKTEKNILYILPSFNMYGGTPKKTLDLIKHSTNQCYLYVWTNAYADEFKDKFKASGANIYEGLYGRNIFKHISALLKIIDENNIEIIQTQFFFGELLVGILKVLRPEVKVIIAFVGSMSPIGYKRSILRLIYRKVNAFVYISNYVKSEKTKVYPRLKQANGFVIYNGTNKQEIEETITNSLEDYFTVLCVSGLTKIKNVQVLIDCMTLLLKNNQNKIKFVIAGDGPEKDAFVKQIKENGLEDNIELLGYSKEVGSLLHSADAFVHPCYVEGFGIAVAEAMMAEKPIVVANAGALPELIKDRKTGLIAHPFNPQEWADAIIELKENTLFAAKLAKDAKQYANAEFSVKRFVSNYNQLYKRILA